VPARFRSPRSTFDAGAPGRHARARGLTGPSSLSAAPTGSVWPLAAAGLGAWSAGPGVARSGT